MSKRINKDHKSYDSLEEIFKKNLIEYKKIADKFFRELNSSLDSVGAKLVLLLERIPNKKEGGDEKIALIKSKFTSSDI